MRIRIQQLGLHIPNGVVAPNGQPCFIGRREPGGRIRRPLHRRSAAVAPQGRFGHAPGILPPLRRNLGFAHSEFVTVVQRWRSAQREQKNRRLAAPLLSESGGQALVVVSAQHVVGPRARWNCRLDTVHHSSNTGRSPGRLQEAEVGRHAQFVEILAVVRCQLARVVDVHLPQGHARRLVPIQKRPHLTEYLMHVCVSLVVLVQLYVVLTQRFVYLWRTLGVRRIVPLRGIFHDEAHRIDAKSVNVPIEPEAQVLEHRCFHRRVAPVQIGLLLQEGMQVILTRSIIQLPG